jgi:hypothetical protein
LGAPAQALESRIALSGLDQIARPPPHAADQSATAVDVDVASASSKPLGEPAARAKSGRAQQAGGRAQQSVLFRFVTPASAARRLFNPAGAIG